MKLPYHLILLSLLAVLGCGLPSALAQGGPPMITDDPGTPGNGHWEINTAITTERRAGEHVTEMPLVDINYGIGDRLQLKYEAAWLRLSDDTGRHDGMSNSLAGVKWRFYDAGEKAWSASVYPQIEFNNPGSHADERGLADHGTSFQLPFQVMKDFGVFEFNADFGLVVHPGENAWFGGMVVGHDIAKGVELAVELHWEWGGDFDENSLAANVGARVDLSEKCTLLLSIGRELHNAREERASMIAYLGLQTRF
jgi:hypothetical protein